MTDTLSPADILNTLAHRGPAFPEAALKAATGQREALTPTLLGWIARAQTEGEALPADFCGHVYALFLLGHFHDPEAFEPLLQLLSQPIETLEQIFSTSQLDHAHRALIATYTDNWTALAEAIANPAINVYSRLAFADVAIGLYLADRVKREPLLELYRQLFAQTHPDSYENEVLLIFLMADALDFHAIELKPQLVALRDQLWPALSELFDPGDIDTRLEHPRNSVLTASRQQKTYRSVDNLVKEMSLWPDFPSSAEQQEGLERLKALLRESEPDPETPLSQRETRRKRQ
ncbi:MAG: DUF1186 domain-containing protein [Candidatus Sericytochromatia bacterium]